MNKADKLTALHNAWATCQGCTLHSTRNSVVFGYGNPDADILVVGEAPGGEEDRQGLPFVGQAGQLLDQYLTCCISTHPTLLNMVKTEEFDYPVMRDILLNKVFYTNVVACHPPENRDPSINEINACKSRLLETIYLVDPILIIGMGRIAVETLVNKRIKITQARGSIFDIVIPGRLIDVTYPLLAVLHTSYLLRVHDFNQVGGLSDKSFEDYFRAKQLVDEYRLAHFDEQPISIGELDEQ